MRAGTIDLNCDLGERDDATGIAADLSLLDIVTSANIACGGHAGDEHSMERTVAAAMERGVALGAHPGYPDPAHFGRAECDIAAQDLEDSIASQVDALLHVIAHLGGELAHVKPHGALYHAAMRRLEIAEVVARGVARVDRRAILVGQSGAPALEVWRRLAFCVADEGFADRCYEADGALRSRKLPNAMIDDPIQAATQAVRIATGLGALTTAGVPVAVPATTIGLHSDTTNAVEIARAIREALIREGVALQSLRQ